MYKIRNILQIIFISGLPTLFRRTIQSKVTLILLLIGLCSCSDQNSDKGSGVLRYNHTNPVTTLDPAFAKSQNSIWTSHHIYSTLLNFDTLTQITDNLTYSHRVSDDGLVYTFYLRDSIFFHDDECFGPSMTRKMNAYDVIYSYERLLDPAIQSPGSWILKDRLVDNGMVAIDSLTLQLTLSKPFPPFLGLLATKYCSIIPQEAVDFYGHTFRSHPVGTGPYQLKRWIEGEVLFLEANDHYFKGKPHLKGVKASYITDKKIAFLSLLHGDLDYISGLESTFSQKLLTPEGLLLDEHRDQLTLKSVPYLNTEYIGLRMTNTNSVLSQKAFRQALNYAIDRSVMLKVLRNKIGYPGQNGIVHPGLEIMMSKLPTGYTYQPETAKKLLSQAGYQTEYQSEEIVLSTNADYLDIITFVARQWEAIGIRVKIDVLESSILRQGMRNGSIDCFRASWIADYPDPENFLTLFYGENPAPPNYTRFKNAKFDYLYQLATTTTNKQNRKNLYAQLDSIIIDEAPVVFLFYDATAIFHSNALIGVELNALNLLEVEQMKKSKNLK